MSDQLTAKIRLVKCPRCRRVLPELSNVPVYQCGGCDAVLQVKKHRNGINDTGLHIYEADITQKKGSKDTETPNEATREKHSVDKIIEMGPKENKHINGFSSSRESFEAAMEEAVDDLDGFLLNHMNLNNKDGKGSKGVGSPGEVDSLTESDHCKSHMNNHQSEVFLHVDEAHDKVTEKKDNWEKNDGNDQVFPSNDLSCHKIDSPQTETSSEFDEDAISRYIFGNFKKEKHLTPQTLSRESTSTENISPSHIEVTDVEPITTKESLENKNLAVNQNLCNQILPPNELSCEELEDSSPVVGTQNESKENFLSRSAMGSLSKKNCLLEENPHNEQVEQPQSRKSSKCNSISSEETLEYIAFKKVDSMYRSNQAYDGSESSLEKTDDHDHDHDHDQYMRLLKGKCTESLPTNSYIDSFSIEKRVYATEGFTHHQDPPVRRWMQFQSDKRLSKDHVSSRDSHEYCTSSKFVGNQLQFCRNSDFRPKFKDPEEEKLKLKKMVLELQNQLNRSRPPKGYASCGLNYNGYPNRFHQMGHSCLQYSPHDWPCSAPLSPHVYTKPNQYAGYTDHNHYNIQCPCSGYPIKSCEMMHSNEKGIKHAPKRHVLPVKGGAPFVICDNCSKLLQLPVDFLLFKKRFHQLRCGSCSYVFKFLLRNGNRLDRYTDRYGEFGDLAPAPPPPSEVDDLRDTCKGTNMSTGRNCPHADSLCVSEDYGPSICKSCSTEGEHLSYNVQKRDMNGKKTSSGGSIDHLNWRRNHFQQSVPKDSQNIYNHAISKAENPSPVIEKLRGRDVSPLHRLMGYNSAREVLNE